MYENYGYKTIAKSLGITYTVCRNLNNKTSIGKKCFIGARAIILSGVIIGD